MRPLLGVWVAALVACAGPQVGSDDTSDPTDDETADDAPAPTGEDEGDDPAMGETPEEEVAPPPEAMLEIAPGCTAKATVGGVPTWLHFVRPSSPCNGVPGSTTDFHAIVELTRLIESVPIGGRIDGHLYGLTIDSVGKALYDAQVRGVDVRISTNGGLAASTDPAKTAYLDKLTGIVYCKAGTNNACISSATSGISHSKLFTFSTATAPDKTVGDGVVWVGSVDPTLSGGTNTFNNTVTIYGDVELYGLMRGYLDDLRARVRAADYYEGTPGRGHYLTPTAHVYVSPEAQSDLIVNRLDDVTPTSTCEVRVMQTNIRDSRMTVVNRLIAMKKGGCNVLVVADLVGPDALAAFKAARIPVRQQNIHDKVFIVKGMYGAGFQYRAYTGSQNLSASGNNAYDEIFVKLAAETDAAHPVYDEFMRHFNDAYSIATPL